MSITPPATPIDLGPPIRRSMSSSPSYPSSIRSPDRYHLSEFKRTLPTYPWESNSSPSDPINISNKHGHIHETVWPTAATTTLETTLSSSSPSTTTTTTTTLTGPGFERVHAKKKALRVHCTERDRSVMVTRSSLPSYDPTPLAHTDQGEWQTNTGKGSRLDQLEQRVVTECDRANRLEAQLQKRIIQEARIECELMEARRTALTMEEQNRFRDCELISLREECHRLRALLMKQTMAPESIPSSLPPTTKSLTPDATLNDPGLSSSPSLPSPLSMKALYTASSKDSNVQEMHSEPLSPLPTIERDDVCQHCDELHSLCQCATTDASVRGTGISAVDDQSLNVSGLSDLNTGHSVTDNNEDGDSDDDDDDATLMRQTSELFQRIHHTLTEFSGHLDQACYPNPSLDIGTADVSDERSVTPLSTSPRSQLVSRHHSWSRSTFGSFPLLQAADSPSPSIPEDISALIDALQRDRRSLERLVAAHAIRASTAEEQLQLITERLCELHARENRSAEYTASHILADMDRTEQQQRQLLANQKSRLSCALREVHNRLQQAVSENGENEENEMEKKCDHDKDDNGNDTEVSILSETELETYLDQILRWVDRLTMAIRTSKLTVPPEMCETACGSDVPFVISESGTVTTASLKPGGLAGPRSGHATFPRAYTEMSLSGLRDVLPTTALDGLFIRFFGNCVDTNEKTSKLHQQQQQQQSSIPATVNDTKSMTRSWWSSSC